MISAPASDAPAIMARAWRSTSASRSGEGEIGLSDGDEPAVDAK